MTNWRRPALVIMLVLLIPYGLAVTYLALLRFVDPPTTPLWLATKNASQEWVDLQAISPNMVQAVVASEDNNFCHHVGFDFQQLGEAIEDWQDGERLRGASTISMQTVKNLFFLPSRSMFRKAAEYTLVPWLELFQRKSRIMEIYLNIIQFGPSHFGVAAAAQHYYGIKPIALTTDQAARLAAVLPAPSLRKPFAQNQRSKRITKNMNNIGNWAACAGGWP